MQLVWFYSRLFGLALECSSSLTWCGGRWVTVTCRGSRHGGGEGVGTQCLTSLLQQTCLEVLRGGAPLAPWVVSWPVATCRCLDCPYNCHVMPAVECSPASRRWSTACCRLPAPQRRTAALESPGRHPWRRLQCRMRWWGPWKRWVRFRCREHGILVSTLV